MKRVITWFMSVTDYADAPIGMKEVNLQTFEYKKPSIFNFADVDEYRCPALDDYESGGAYVDDAYCRSFCQGKGCQYIKGCRARKAWKLVV